MLLAALALAGSSVAGEARPLSASSPTITEAPTAEPNHGPPLLREQMQQTEPQGAADPPPAKPDLGAIALQIAVGLAIVFALALWAGRGDAGIRGRTLKALRAIRRARRRNAPLLIVTGAAIVAASLTVLRHMNIGYDYPSLEQAILDEWLTFGGALLAIIGIYDKIRYDPPPKI